MGYSSWDCLSCGHPLLAHDQTNEVNHWMEKGVVLRPDGAILVGTFDGYGRIGAESIWLDPFGQHPDAGVYHYSCWMKAGRPPYSGPSSSSDDQGYFFDAPEHDKKKPKIRTKKTLASAAKPAAGLLSLRSRSPFAELSQSTFRDFIAQPGSLVYLWLPWCKRCQDANRYLSRIARACEGMLRVGSYNIEAEGDPGPPKLNLSVVPFFAIFINGRLYDEIMDWEGPKAFYAELKPHLAVALKEIGRRNLQSSSSRRKISRRGRAK